MTTWVLDATTKKIEASMSGAPATTNPTFMSSYSDQTATTFTPGSNNGSLNGVTAVSLVVAPAASTQRIIKDITIYNKDTAAVTITLRIDVSATDFELFVFTLAAGGTWSLASLREARGTTPVNEGGTGLSSYTLGDLLYASAATTLAKLADVAVGAYLRSGGVATAPLWSTLILPNAATAFRLPVATSANTIGEVAAVGATGEYLAGATGAIPAWATLNQAAVAGLTTAAGPTFAHLHISDLAAIYTAAESWIGPSSTTGVYFKGGNYGFGTTVPDTLFTLNANLADGSTGDAARFYMNKGETNAAYLKLSGTSHPIASARRIRLDVYDGGGTARDLALQSQSGGNVGVLTETSGGSGTVGAGVLSLGNGTAPVGGVANQVSLFSQDVLASAELFAMDEAGNTPQLTPHPGDFLNTLPLMGREYPWAYTSANAYLGKRIQVDMMGAIREVERLTGKKFIVLSDLAAEERTDWDAGQEAQAQVRQQTITAAQEQFFALNDQIARENDQITPDLAKVKELIASRDAVKVPAPYKKKPPPKWMKDRGVVSTL